MSVLEIILLLGGVLAGFGLGYTAHVIQTDDY